MFKNREIADLVAQQMGLPRDQVRETILQLQSHIVDKVKDGERVHMRGFGTFKVRNIPERTYHIKWPFMKPKVQTLPPTHRFKFHFSPTFRKRVNAVTTPLTHAERVYPEREQHTQQASKPWWKFW